MQLQLVCSKCDSPAQELKHEIVKNDRIAYLSCGCIDIVPLSKATDIETFSFDDGRIPRPFQRKTLAFERSANHRFLCTHQTGLGKTVCACGSLLLWTDELCPALILCKSAAKTQWAVEVIRLCGMSLMPQVLESKKDKIIKSMKVVVSSYDLVKSMPVEAFSHFKTVILDECQQIKNTASQRTQAIQQICAGKPNILGFSATPFLNHLLEFYPILNLLNPGRFYSEKEFARRFVATYWNGSTFKYGGLQEGMEEQFKRLTQDLVIGFSRREVAPELPEIIRGTRFCDFTTESRKKYQRQMREFEQAMDAFEESASFENRSALNASLMELKHIAGQTKVEPAVEYIREFLEGNPANGKPGKKFTCFVHHIDVGDDIAQRVTDELCSEFDINPPIRIKGGMTDSQRAALGSSTAENHWPTNDPKDRILVASTLAGGESLNLQACHDAMQVERQWNPGKEEQAEGRFPRICSLPSHSCNEPKLMNYLILLGSVDEVLTEIVERKRVQNEHSMRGESTPIDWGSESDMMMAVASAMRERK